MMLFVINIKQDETLLLSDFMVVLDIHFSRPLKLLFTLDKKPPPTPANISLLSSVCVI